MKAFITCKSDEVIFMFDGDSFMYKNMYCKGVESLSWESLNGKYSVFWAFGSVQAKRGISKKEFKAFHTRVLNNIKRKRLRYLAAEI